MKKIYFIIIYIILSFCVFSQENNLFITLWDTRLVKNWLKTPINEIDLPLEENGIYDFLIDWGDNSKNTIKCFTDKNKKHNYKEPGIYKIIIKGTIKGWSFKNNHYASKLIKIINWGSFSFEKAEAHFYECRNMFISAKDVPPLANARSLKETFARCYSLITIPNIESWKTNNIEDMSHLFGAVYNFNQDISKWNTSKVTNMSGMFNNAYKFNQNIDSWDTSNVEDMGGMFAFTNNFNKDLNSWKTSKVNDMKSMFYGALRFNGKISNWDTSNVTNMSKMFSNAYYFNSDISKWDTSNVKEMSGMFSGAYSFNQDISKWDTSNVEEMLSMFYHAYNFNKPLSGWDTKKMTTMENMFRNCYNFDQDISHFNIENVKSFKFMLNNVSFRLENYYKLIHSWSKQNISKRGVSIRNKSRFINDDILQLKDKLHHKYGWNIQDMGQIYIVKKPGFKKNEFVTAWKDENASSPMITLPLVQNGKYNFTVDWGDGTVSRITKWDSKKKIHYYKESKIYIVKMSGTIIGWQFVDSKNSGKLLEIMNWGNLILGDTNNQFKSCWKMIISAKDKPNLSQTTSLAGMFKFCSRLEITGSISNWDLSSIIDMSEMFYGATMFNYDISRWNTKNVASMKSLFGNAYSFNKDISKWDTGKVTDMKRMFASAHSFDQDISRWDTSNVTDMSYMFINAHCFNQDISKWDTSKVKSMKQMFANTHRFNQDLSKWNTANLVNSEDIFKMSRSFDYDISKWKNFNK